MLNKYFKAKNRHKFLIMSQSQVNLNILVILI